jgi:hypothetical protein
VKAQNLAGLGDLDDEASAITIGRHYLCAALAQNVDPARDLPLDKYQGAFRVRGCMFDMVEAFQGTFRQSARITAVAEFAGYAVINHRHAVWRVSSCGPIHVRRIQSLLCFVDGSD